MSCRLSRTVLAGLIALLPALALIAPLAAAPVFAAVGLVAVLPWLWRERTGPGLRPLAREPFLWLTGGLLLWGALTLAWSDTPAQGGALLPRVVLVLAMGAALAHRLRQAAPPLRDVVCRALLVGLGLAAVWLVIDMLLLDQILTARLTGHYSDPENVPKRGLTLLALMIWPAAFILGRRRWWAGVTAVAGLAALTLASDAGAAKLALAVGAVTFGLGWLSARWTARAAGAAVILGVLAMPVILPPLVDGLNLLEATSGSARHRLVIWTFVSEHIHERPMTGWGFNMARAFPGGSEIDPLTGGEFIPLHPHNAPLQWWLELGLPGALLGIAAVLVLLRHLRRDAAAGRAGQAMALATLAAAMTVLLIGYGAWQLWWLSGLALTAGLVAAALPPPSRP